MTFYHLRRSRGARHRSNLASAGDSIGRNTKRNIYKGYSELSGLAKLSENKDTTYNDKEEQKLFETKTAVKNLITELEKKDLKKDEKVEA